MAKVPIRKAKRKKARLSHALRFDRPVLYSTITRIAYNINMRYYGDRHYLWCSPHFKSDAHGASYTVSPTSSPFEIYMTLRREVTGSDGHSEKIRLNRLGLVHGAQAMRKRKLISETQKNQIEIIAREAPIGLFRPFICIIPSSIAGKYCTEVEPSARASYFSQEYIAVDMPNSVFDMIDLE